MADLDFNNADSRMKYLQEHLGHLMKGIDTNYSSVMLEELVHRLEKTVSEFNEEVKAMLAKLQGKDESLSIFERPMESPVKAEPAPPPTDSGDVLSAFEKKLQNVSED